MAKQTRKMKTRKSKKSRKYTRKSRKSRKSLKGGAYVPDRLPREAAVIWRNLQEDEDATPVLTSYEQTREDLELDE